MTKSQILSPRELHNQFLHLIKTGYTHVKLPNNPALPAHLREATIGVTQAQTLLQLAITMKNLADEWFAEAFSLANGHNIIITPHSFSVEKLAVFLPQISSGLILEDASTIDAEANGFLLALSSAVIQKPARK